jgi:hypothetical protein
MASAPSALLVLDVPSKVYPGLPFTLTVLKTNALNQTIISDSSTLLQIQVSSDEYAPNSMKSYLSDLTAFKLHQGTAVISVATSAFYSLVDPKSITLIHNNFYLFIHGMDSETLQSLYSAPTMLTFSRGYASCPSGYVLDLSSSSATGVTGKCALCKAGTYSLNPLVGRSLNQTMPSCLECPTGAYCSGGDQVQFQIGLWEAQAGIFILVSCPPGHMLVNSVGGVFSQSAQTCSPCQRTEYILDTNSSRFHCQPCPTGAVCNGESLTGTVPGSVWWPDMASGQYILQSCPPGYEIANTESGGSFLAVNQQCSPCPVSFYCTGGSAARNACPAGSFTPSLANSSSSCAAVVFVALTVTIPLTTSDFDSTKQRDFHLAVALTCRVAASHVLMVSVSQTRRSATVGSDSRVEMKIAAADATSAANVAASLTTDALNERLVAVGLPKGTVLSATVQSTSTVQDKQLSTVAVVALSVGGAALLLMLVAGIAFAIHGKKSFEDQQLDCATTLLRVRLGITQANGFLLGSETPPWWQRRWEYTTVQQDQLEAAARLSLYWDFDVSKFDSLCLLLESAVPRPVATGSTRNLFSRTSSGSRRTSPAYEALRGWLLETSSALLRPCISLPAQTEGAGAAPVATDPVRLRQEDRFTYLKRHILLARVWNEENGFLFEQLQGRVRQYMKDIARLCDERFADILLEPGGDLLMSLSAGPEQLAAGHVRRQDHAEVRDMLV